MYQTSKEYKESMKRPIRNASYMKVLIGLINQEAQGSASLLEENKYSEYSDASSIYEKHSVNRYATYEQDMFKADGNLFFIPRLASDYKKDGIISNDLFAVPFLIKFEFGCGESDIKGLTIKFGDNYPTKFRIITSTGNETEFTSNSSYFETDTVFEQTSSIGIEITEMKVPNGRVRLDYIQFGLGLEYGNDWIIEASSTSSLSVIDEDLPETDFSITLHNEEQIFNVDNPSSEINFLETGQPVTVMCGYAMDDGSVEWMTLHTMRVYEWSANDKQAKINAVDRFRFMSNNYYKGKYYDDGITLYDLALLVLSDAGMTSDEYYLDTYLQKVVVNNPLPNVPHKEALQIIANAGRCIMDYDRFGRTRIYSAFVPSYETTSNGTPTYSDVSSIDKNDSKEDYATYENNYWIANGNMLFVPESGIGNTGYVSSAVSDDNGTFSENPIITRTLEAKYKSYGIVINFSGAIPDKFIIRTYADEVLNDTVTIDSGIERENELQYDFKEFDKMKIEFVQTKPNSRIHINYISLGSDTNYKIEYDDLLATPVGTQLDKVKNLNVSRSIYAKSSSKEELLSEEIVYDGENQIYYIDNPSYGYEVSIESPTSDQSVSVVNSGSYYVEVAFTGIKVGDAVKISVSGYKYNVSTSYYTKAINNRGNDKEWKNPIISDYSHCQIVAEWLADYYSAGVEYELSYRGEPAIDVGDSIFQENKYNSELKVIVEESQLSFDGTISGILRTRRK